MLHSIYLGPEFISTVSKTTSSYIYRNTEVLKGSSPFQERSPLSHVIGEMAGLSGSCELEDLGRPLELSLEC